MDFIQVAYKENQDGTREFYPSLQAIESQDLVIRGGQFMAVWDEDRNLYDRRQSHLPAIIDRAFSKMVGDALRPGDVVKKVQNFNNQIFNRVLSLIRSVGDMGPELDQRMVYADQTPSKEDAATFKMPYSLSDAPCDAWNELCSVLYGPEERIKFEWSIGATLLGIHATQIQKFYVFYGKPGTGKSTILDVIEMIFGGHCETFDAKEMGRAESQFSLEPFSRNPMVGIDQDADLSRIDSNINLNKISAHDRVFVNPKGKTPFPIIPRTTLFIGTNHPVKITDRKSGLFRRIVDIHPTGITFDSERYNLLTSMVKFELGSIAQHCIRVFEDLGPTYLSSYRAIDMMYRTNDIFNFVEDNRLILSNGVTLKQAFKLYGDWCEETDTKNVYKQFQFRDSLSDYFKEFHDSVMVDGVRYRSYFMGLLDLEKFSWKGLAPKPDKEWLKFDVQPSIIDEYLKDMPAQLASSAGTPKIAWENVKTTLSELDTSKEHFVKVPTQHIVIDFDLKDEIGEKSLAKCLEAAAVWPPTYAEPSRSGGGLHLHYEWDGDVTKLASSVREGIEIKTLLGGSSLRRRYEMSNGVPVATISAGLPFKEERVLTPNVMQTEKGLRELVLKGLRKDVHIGTKPNMDFIKMVTDEAYEKGIIYNIEDMWDDILQFAMGSSNQKTTCIEIAQKIHLKSESDIQPTSDENEKPLVDFDIEVYPNMVKIGWMYDREDSPVTIMTNPKPHEVEEFINNFRLVGYFNRGYDNHILWALTLGYSVSAVYELSKRLVSSDGRNAGFGAAWNLAYMDLYDVIVEKHSLKWWQIKLGLPHMEMDLPWDEPVPADREKDVDEYLVNDVQSTRAVRLHRDADVRARQILAELTGLQVCNTNRQHTEKLVFKDVPWDVTPELVYTDLREMFPGYKFDQFAPGKEKSEYKGHKVGEGGWVDSEPGYYENVAVLDVASMHPTSIVELNMFGEYTKNFKELLDARLAIKAGDLTKASGMFDGRIAPYLGDPEAASALSDALKIVINSVYGLTAASFPNKFKAPRNIDNIVAKRGALFMVDLKEFVEKAGFKVVHVKTDSIKIPDATPEIIAQVSEFGKQYGYNFEHEATYDRFCLVNDSTFVCRYGWAAKEKLIGTWSATAAQFQHPIVFKTLFSKEEIQPTDYVEVKQVAGRGVMYLVNEESGNRTFVGKFGAFVPVLGGRQLLRVDGEKESAVGGTKGYEWELDTYALTGEFDVDYQYFQNLVDSAKQEIEKYVPYAEITRP
jgi:hypothetical protein